AVAADEEGVRARRRADDARRPRRGRDASPDRPLHVPAGRAHDAAGRVRLLRGDLRRVRARPRRLVPGPRRAPAAPRRPPGGAEDLPLLARLSGGAVRLHGGRRPLVDWPPWIAVSRAATSAPP